MLKYLSSDRSAPRSESAPLADPPAALYHDLQCVRETCALLAPDTENSRLDRVSGLMKANSLGSGEGQPLPSRSPNVTAP